MVLIRRRRELWQENQTNVYTADAEFSGSPIHQTEKTGHGYVQNAVRFIVRGTGRGGIIMKSGSTHMYESIHVLPGGGFHGGKQTDVLPGGGFHGGK